MVDHNPPLPHQLVGEVLGTGRLPNDIFATLSDRFRITKEDGGSLSAEKRSDRGVHSLLAHLASGVDPVPGFGWVVILQVEPDGTVYVLYTLFSIPADMYSTARRLFACRGELPRKGLTPVVELPVDIFAVLRSVRAVPRADHIIHLERVSPTAWQVTTSERVRKAAEGGSNLSS